MNKIALLRQVNEAIEEIIDSGRGGSVHVEVTGSEIIVSIVRCDGECMQQCAERNVTKVKNDTGDVESRM